MVKELMTLNEFCETFSISRNKAYIEEKAGRLIFCKSGSRTMVRRRDAEQWMKALPKKPKGK